MGFAPFLGLAMVGNSSLSAENQSPVKKPRKQEDDQGEETSRGLHLVVDRDSVGANLVARVGIQE